MQKRQTAGVIAVTAIVVAALLALQLGVLPIDRGTAPTTVTTCSGCSSQVPVVDVIMPALGSEGNTTNPNRVLNLTVGTDAVYEVDVYPTAEMVFGMGFRSLLVSAAPGETGNNVSGAIAASFNPPMLTVAANAKGTTQMTLQVTNSAPRGTYDVVVSAFDVTNSSDVWGLYFQVVVS